MHAGSYQSLSWGASSIGGIVSAYFSGSLIEKYGTSFVFGVTAVFPLLVLASALLITEKAKAPVMVPEPVDAESNGASKESGGAEALKGEVVSQVWFDVGQSGTVHELFAL